MRVARAVQGRPGAAVHIEGEGSGTLQGPQFRGFRGTDSTHRPDGKQAPALPLSYRGNARVNYARFAEKDQLFPGFRVGETNNWA